MKYEWFDGETHDFDDDFDDDGFLIEPAPGGETWAEIAASVAPPIGRVQFANAEFANPYHDERGRFAKKGEGRRVPTRGVDHDGFDDAALPEEDVKVQNVPVTDIVPGNNDRKTFEGLQELADSIAEHGLAQPITVRPREGDPPYEIVAGERRWRAHQLLGAETIPAIVRDLSDREASGIMLAENLARQDINPMDEAEGYASRMEEFGLSVEEVAAMGGVKPHRVKTYLPLMNLSDELKDQVRSGAITQGIAYEMVGQNGVVLDSNRQLAAFRAYASEGLTMAQLRHVVARLVNDQSQDSMFDTDSFMQVEEWTREAKTRKVTKKQLVSKFREVIDALEQADPSNPLIEQARLMTDPDEALAAAAGVADEMLADSPTIDEGYYAIVRMMWKLVEALGVRREGVVGEALDILDPVPDPVTAQATDKAHAYARFANRASPPKAGGHHPGDGTGGLTEFANPYHDERGRFARKGEGRRVPTRGVDHDGFDDAALPGVPDHLDPDVIPALPGTTPIGPNQVRLYHRTRSLEALESIRATGLRVSSGLGETYGEPNAVWGSARLKDFDPQNQHFIEFVVDWDDIVDRFDVVGGPSSGTNPPWTTERWMARGGNIALPFDVPTSAIVAIHEPWHEAYRQLNDPVVRDGVLAGHYDNLGHDPLYAKAMKRVRQELGMPPLPESPASTQFANPYHDERGRFTEKGKGRRVPTRGIDFDDAEMPDVASGIADRTLRDMGSTTFLGTENPGPVTAGKVVSTHPERSVQSPWSRDREQMKAKIHAYREANDDLLSQDGYALGTWLDKDTGTLWLDVVTVVETSAEAERLAREHNQIAYYDLDTQEEVRTGGTGEAQAALTPRLYAQFRNPYHDERGRFTDKDGDADGDSDVEIDHDPEFPLKDGFKRVFTHAQRLQAAEERRVSIPPGWSSIQVSQDPEREGLRARGIDAAGRIQPRYSPEHIRSASAEKFQRILSFQDRHADRLDDALRRDAETDPTAGAAAIMRRMGLRPGSLADTKAKVQAYGATTLEARHVRFGGPDGNTVFFDFTGKKGVRIRLKTRSKLVRETLRAHTEGKQPGDRIFETSDKRTNAYIRRILPDTDFTNKDLRTILGTGRARRIVRRMPIPKTAAAKRKARKQVAEKVAAVLGNEPGEALRSYIAPEVFDEAGW